VGGDGSNWWRSSRTKPGGTGKGVAPEVWITANKELVVKVSFPKYKIKKINVSGIVILS
jgi:hypothetical protein